MRDPRFFACNGEVAASELRGIVEAKRFVDGEQGQFTGPFTPLTSLSGDETATQALFGERFRILDDRGGRAFGQLSRDGYVGYAPSKFLGAVKSSTHRITVLSSHFYSAPDLRSPVRQGPTLGGELRAVAERNGFLEVENQGFIPSRQASELIDRPTDYVSVAEKFAGAPYLWGGKTCFGIDCSGLVQLAMHETGLQCPRDSDLQEREFSTRVAKCESGKRGDLAFWKGHVGIFLDTGTILHATAHTMDVAVEPFARVRKRIDSLESHPFLGVRRI
ncbi:MAG: NlpC/P60 family protein [Albidovulum sp.]|nr:NlpC/P60 family protein [Albidovulum sp.]